MMPITSDGIHGCKNCGHRCALNYLFCYKCVSALPQELRAEMFRRSDHNNNAERRRKHDFLASDAVSYLRSDDRKAFTEARANEGEFWAERVMLASGEWTQSDVIERIKRSAEMRATKEYQGTR